MKPQFIVTVAGIIQDDENVIELFVQEATELLKQNFNNYEILLIDNGSVDNSVSLIKNLQSKYTNLRLITLSKKYDEEHARAAALDNSIGDYVVLMNVNYDPLDVIPTMVNKSLEGFELVIGERMNRDDDSLIEKLSAKLFYKLSEKLAGYKINPNYSDFVCLSRKMVNSLVQIKDRSRYLKYLNIEVGFKHATVKFERVKRTEQSKKRDFFASVGFALEMLITNSDKLLRLTALSGFLISFINLIYILYIMATALFKQDIAEGWISSSMVNSTMFFFMFLFLSIISIYISSVLKETKKGSLYYVFDETSSSVIYRNNNKKNIV